MQIKAMMRYHLTPVRMTITKNPKNDRYWGGYGEKGTLIYCWWECKLVHSLWKALWKFFKDPKRELSFNPTIPLLEICPMEYKLSYHKDTCRCMFTAALVTMART